jgi:hypothetical protein
VGERVRKADAAGGIVVGEKTRGARSVSRIVIGEEKMPLQGEVGGVGRIAVRETQANGEENRVEKCESTSVGEEARSAGGVARIIESEEQMALHMSGGKREEKRE